jgi:hypothetical protein
MMPVGIESTAAAVERAIIIVFRMNFINVDIANNQFSHWSKSCVVTVKMPRDTQFVDIGPNMRY